MTQRAVFQEIYPLQVLHGFFYHVKISNDMNIYPSSCAYIQVYLSATLHLRILIYFLSIPERLRSATEIIF